MKKKELKHMRRRELLEMLLLQSKEIERLRSIVESDRRIASGSDPPDGSGIADPSDLRSEQAEEIRSLRKKVEYLEQELEKKEICISNAGSIADAALQINKVFEAAQHAADQYLENIARIGVERAAAEREKGSTDPPAASAEEP